VPKLGGPITAMIGPVGSWHLHDAARVGQDIADNLATKKYADPNQGIYDGIQQNLLKNFGAGVAF